MKFSLSFASRWKLKKNVDIMEPELFTPFLSWVQNLLEFQYQQEF